MILAVDLASRFSAAMVRDLGGRVLWQGDSRDMSAFEWCDLLAGGARRFRVTYIVIEDLPYGISSQAQTKPPSRLQGALGMALRDLLDRVFMLNPSTWMADYPGVPARKGTTDESRTEAMRIAALNLGYEPPNLVQEHIDSLPEGAKVMKKHTNPLRKTQSDYVASFLISDWTLRQIAERRDLHAITGVQEFFI